MIQLDLFEKDEIELLLEKIAKLDKDLIPLRKAIFAIFGDVEKAKKLLSELKEHRAH